MDNVLLYGIGGGRGRLRGVDPDGPQGGAAGDRARLRRSARRGPRERLAKYFKIIFNFLVRFSPPIHLLVLREFRSGLLPEADPV